LNNKNEAVEEEQLLDHFLLIDLEHLGQDQEQSSEHHRLKCMSDDLYFDTGFGTVIYILLIVA
jgi:hypothetical protein